MARCESELEPTVPQALVDKSNVWATETIIGDKREQIAPLLGRTFVRLWAIAEQQREPIIAHIQGTGVDKIYEERVTLNDGSKIDVNDLLNFNLYSKTLDVPSNLPTETARQYTIQLGLGGDIGSYLRSHAAGQQISYLSFDGWLESTRKDEAKKVFETLASPYFQPHNICLKETVGTTLPLPDGRKDYYAKRDHTHSLSSQSTIGIQVWTPNLSYFGVNQDLPPEAEVNFYHKTAEGTNCRIDNYGSFKGDKMEIAKALIRLEELTDFVETYTETSAARIVANQLTQAQ